MPFTTVPMGFVGYQGSAAQEVVNNVRTQLLGDVFQPFPMRDSHGTGAVYFTDPWMVDFYGFSCRYTVHTWILGVKNRNFTSRFACRVSRFAGILRKVYRYIHQTTLWGTERCIVYFISSLWFAYVHVCLKCIHMYPPQPHFLHR